MKKILFSTSLLAILFYTSLLYGAEKVVVIPLNVQKVAFEKKTFQYNLPPSAFTRVMKGESGNFISGEWLYLYPDLVLGIAAPLHLDDGAEITDFTCYTYDNDIMQSVHNNSPSKLWRRSTLSPDAETVAYIATMETTGASTSLQSFSAPSIDYPIIDNLQYTYGVYMLCRITNLAIPINSIRFYGCSVTYTLDVMTQ